MLPCALPCSQGFLCATLKIAQPDDRSAPRRYSNILSSTLKEISCATCRSASPCRRGSAGSPQTFTSSVSNSGLITLAHVLCLIVNQSCHAFAGDKLRGPVGAGIFASLTRDTSGSRLPANTLLKSSVEGSSGLQPPLLLATVELSGQQWFRVESQLWTWVREDSFPALAMVVETALMSLLDRSLQIHFQSLWLSQALQRDRSHLQDPLGHQSGWAHNPRKGWPSLFISIVDRVPQIPVLDFDTAGSECINRRMNKQQARPCKCARTRQTMRFGTRHRDKTPIACSLEPCADVRTTVLSQLNSVTRTNQTARVTTCSKRYVSARVGQSFYLNRCGALGPTAVEDDLISEQQDTHVEKSRRLAFSVQDSFLNNTDDDRYCQRMLQNSRLSNGCGEQGKGDTGRKSACAARDLHKYPAQDGRQQNVPLCRPSTPTEECVWSPYKNCAPQIRCNGKPRQHKDVKGSVNSCLLSLCVRNTKLSHTCMTCLQIDSVSHWTLDNIAFHGTRFSAQRQLMSYLTSAAFANDW